MPFDLDTILVTGKPDRTYADKVKSKQTRYRDLFPTIRQPMTLSGNMASSLLLNIARIIPYQLILRYLRNSPNRNSRVLLGIKVTIPRVLKNGLLQWSPSSNIFNIYTYLLRKISKKLIYANDICIATQCKNSKIVKKIKRS